MNKLDFIYTLAEKEAKENNVEFTEEVIDLLFLNIPTAYSVQELEEESTKQFEKEAESAVQIWLNYSV